MNQLLNHTNTTPFHVRRFPFCYGKFTEAYFWTETSNKGQYSAQATFDPYRKEWTSVKKGKGFDLVFMEELEGLVVFHEYNLDSENCISLPSKFHLDAMQIGILRAWTTTKNLRSKNSEVAFVPPLSPALQEQPQEQPQEQAADAPQELQELQESQDLPEPQEPASRVHRFWHPLQTLADRSESPLSNAMEKLNEYVSIWLQLTEEERKSLPVGIERARFEFLKTNSASEFSLVHYSDVPKKSWKGLPPHLVYHYTPPTKAEEAELQRAGDAFFKQLSGG